MNQTKSPSEVENMTAWIHAGRVWQCGNVRVINATGDWRIEKMYPRTHWWVLVKAFTEDNFMGAIEYAEEITE